MPDAETDVNIKFQRVLDDVLNEIDREALVRLTRELVRIPSVYRPEQPDGNEAHIARFVADYLERAGFSVGTEEVAPHRPNVWAVWEGERPGKTLLFEAHTDVVTEGSAEDWDHPPLGAERAVRDSGVSFPGRLILCHPVDEEGMMAGIKAFIERGHAEGVDAAVICEPEENQLCIKQKGALRVEVTLRGRMAHGAMPRSGVNPVTRAARFVVAVEELESEEIERHGEDPFLGYPSLTPTILMGPGSGEPQVNVIPSTAYVALDIRTVPDQSHRDLVERLEVIIARLGSEDPDFDATLEVIEERPPTETPKDEPLAMAMARAYGHLTGEEPTYNGVPGATDGTFLHAWAGIPIVTTGAGDREIPHHADEWVDEEELLATCKLYAATALYYAYGEEAHV